MEREFASLEAVKWLLGNDTGLSSKTILAAMLNIDYPNGDIPYDNGDFGRCYRLLQIFPVWRYRLWEVLALHPEWRPIVNRWDELEAHHKLGESHRVFEIIKECRTEQEVDGEA